MKKGILLLLASLLATTPAISADGGFRIKPSVELALLQSDIADYKRMEDSLQAEMVADDLLGLFKATLEIGKERSVHPDTIAPHRRDVRQRAEAILGRRLRAETLERLAELLSKQAASSEHPPPQ